MSHECAGDIIRTKIEREGRAEARRRAREAHEVTSEDLTRAMRTFELHAGPAALRYPEAQKWHLRDLMAMRQVLEEFIQIKAPSAN